MNEPTVHRAWATRMAKVAAIALLGSFVVLPQGAAAHPLGEGNCWPRYHTWVAAQDDLAAKQEELANATDSLEAAVASGSVFGVLYWTVVVAGLSAEIPGLRARVDETYQLFLDCDHF